MRVVMRFYVLLLVASSVGIAVVLTATGYGVDEWPIVGILAVLGLLGDRGGIRLSTTVEVSTASLPIILAAVIGGPLPAMIVAATAMLGDFRRPYERWLIFTTTSAITAAATALVAQEASRAVSSDLGAIALASAAAVLVHEALDIAFAALTVGLRRAGSSRAVIAMLLPVVGPSFLLWTAVIAPLGIAYEELSPWAVVLFLVPTLAAQRLFAMYQEQRRLASDLGEANERLERANLSFASALVTTLDARDRYTAGHSAAVAVYARDIATGMGLPPETQQLAHLSGLLHDIGKIGVPPGVLEKEGPLTLEERQKMEEHSEIGERILANVEAYGETALIVRHHHERIDGQGYPDGLIGDAIPLISRIICVADAYNAMTSDRPYRDAMPVELARERLRGAAGVQFDACVVAVFDRILESATETYASGISADFAIEAQAHPELVAQPTAA